MATSERGEARPLARKSRDHGLAHDRAAKTRPSIYSEDSPDTNPSAMLMFVICLVATGLTPPFRHLVVWRGVRGEFRRQEWRAAGGMDWRAANPKEHCDEDYETKWGDTGPPLFGLVDATESELKKIAAKSVLVRYILELWGSGDDITECANDVTPAAEGPWKLCVMRLGRGRKRNGNLQHCPVPKSSLHFDTPRLHFFGRIVSVVRSKLIILVKTFFFDFLHFLISFLLFSGFLIF